MPRVLALVDDLLFLSRIREAARRGDGDVEVRPVRRPAQLVEGVREGARLVLVDADSTRLPWVEAVAALREEEPGGSSPPIVAFFSHVNTDRAERAQAAGCDRVLARGAFVKELPSLLAATGAPASSLEEPAP
jgi:CheY-like chemotaxis protein